MRIEIRCNICSNNKAAETSPYKRYSRLSFVNDEGIYEFICPDGHKTRTVLRTPKHEVLFTMASEALLDGYFREAITGFAASLEKFYEFAIYVICRANSIPEKEFNNCLKLIKKQSERQLGAFAVLWLVAIGTSPNLLSNNLVQLRNEVTHQGKIPTYKECITYGQGVINVIYPIEHQMLDKFPKAYEEQCSLLVKSVPRQPDERFSILSIESVLSAAIQNNMDLESCLEILRESREIKGIQSINLEEYRVTTVFPT